MNTVEKALKILAEVSNQKGEPITVKKLSEKLDINRSTCFHIVKTLTDNGFLEKISHSKGYVLGLEAYFLSRFGNYAENEIAICRPLLKWLYKKSGCPVILATIKNQKKFILEYYDFEHRVFPDYQKIREDDIYRTATGRIILANMSAAEIKMIYNKYKNPDPHIWSEVNSYESLTKELEKIDKKGVVKTVRKYGTENMLSIGYGCAVFKGINLIGAIGIAIDIKENELNSFYETEVNLKKLLKKTANEISRRMMYT